MLDRRFSSRTRRAPRRGAFTLIEVLVALGIMMLLMAIILIPINMGLNVFHIGKARSEVQQANQLVINQLTAELKRAIHVFPNENIPGITDKAPYTNNTTSPNFGPYYDAAATPPRVSNTARLDFLLPKVAGNGATLTPTQPSNYIVTYYARRLNDTIPYDVFSNPVVLWRAQYAHREDDGDPSPLAANISATRYSDWSQPANNWLMQENGEPNLADQSLYLASTVAASHTQITPRDMVLVAPGVIFTPPSYQPDSSFTCDDANGDGKIDRVTISLLLAKYDSVGAEGDKSQQIRTTQTVDLPNVK